MKYITFTVPCYNSAAYMERCINSLLAFKNEVEIINVDDGLPMPQANILKSWIPMTGWTPILYGKSFSVLCIGKNRKYCRI